MSGKRTQFTRLTWSAKTGKAFNHGTVGGYNRHGCRCDECFEAFTSTASYARELAIYKAASECNRGPA